MRIIIAGGGTGGHVYPALAIADALKASVAAIDILFIGALGRMEMEKVPQAGYAIVGLPVAGFQRRLTWKNLLFPFKLLASLWKSWLVIRKFKPDAAVGVGGYASGPALRVAAWMGLPIILQEQNSHAGITNRLLGAKAKFVCVAWPGMERFFPADKLVMTGNPLRHQLTTGFHDREEAFRFFGLDANKKTIVLLGGSLGAPSLNYAVMSNQTWWEQQYDLQLIWQCGPVHFAKCSQHSIKELPQVHLMPFIQQMHFAYEVADVIIARAGALTIAELCHIGKPVILVPSPYVAEDHQSSNARALESQGAAVFIPDAEAKDRIFVEAKQLLAQPETATNMGKALALLAKPDAAQHVAQVILSVIKTGN